MSEHDKNSSNFSKSDWNALIFADAKEYPNAIMNPPANYFAGDIMNEYHGRAKENNADADALLYRQNVQNEILEAASVHAQMKNAEKAQKSIDAVNAVSQIGKNLKYWRDKFTLAA